MSVQVDSGTQAPYATGGGNGPARQALSEASLGELFKRLSADGSNLVKQEIQLAKTELHESAVTAAKASVKMGIAAGLALTGILAVTGALIIGLGILINSYWLSALVVGVVMLVAASVQARSALAAFRSGLAPRETVKTLHDNVDWAKRESARVKQKLSA
ncbi:MAG TPA: phage holin family protein [Gemmatimonadaceae bacterium]|nr:phage holin family protein [Gemmatimonadaceae bacterium]